MSAGAARHGQELALEADQAARRNAVFEAHAALAVGLHVLQVAAARAELFHHRALVGFFDVDRQHFVRLLFLAVDFLDHHARARHGQFIAFAAHVFEQDGQVQFAAARDHEDVGVGGEFDTCSATLLMQFALQALAHLAAGDELAFAAGERRGVDLEIHGQRRLVDFQQRQRLGLSRVASA